MAADTELRAAGQADGWSGKRVEGVSVELQRVKKGGRVGPPRCGLSALFSFFFRVCFRTSLVLFSG